MIKVLNNNKTNVLHILTCFGEGHPSLTSESFEIYLIYKKIS